MRKDGYSAANDRTKIFEDNATNGQPPEFSRRRASSVIAS